MTESAPANRYELEGHVVRVTSHRPEARSARSAEGTVGLRAPAREGR